MAAGAHPLRSIADFLGLLTKNRPQQSLLARKLLLTFWCNLTNQNIAGVNFGANPNYPVLIQMPQRLFGNVRNVTGDNFWTKLGLADFGHIVNNVNRGKDIVLKVVASPRHKGYQ